MRLFIGVALPSPLKDAAAAAADALRERIAASAPRAVLKWVNAANLHLTLVFLGEVAPQRVGQLETVLSEPYATPSFTLRIGGAGIFPSSGPPRALWLGTPAGGDGLASLHRELGHRLIAFGVEPERRPFSAHLTIARFKDASRSDTKQVQTAIHSVPAHVGECRVDAVTLFESQPSPRGPHYEHRLRVPLS
jgi:2'-5' RNA ligase